MVAAGVVTTTAHPPGGCGGSAAALAESAATARHVVANNSASRFTLPPLVGGTKSSTESGSPTTAPLCNGDPTLVTFAVSSGARIASEPLSQRSTSGSPTPRRRGQSRPRRLAPHQGDRRVQHEKRPLKAFARVRRHRFEGRSEAVAAGADAGVLAKTARGVGGSLPDRRSARSGDHRRNGKGANRGSGTPTVGHVIKQSG